MSYEVYQDKREAIADQQAQKWHTATLEIAQLVELWGYEEVFKAVRRLETSEARDQRYSVENENAAYEYEQVNYEF